MHDLHIHSKYSFDGLENPEHIVKKAIKNGLKQIAITDHFEFKDGVLTFSNQLLKQYIDELNALKQKYFGQIELLVGLEIGYVKEKELELADALKNIKLDYVINSVHMVDGFDCYETQGFIGKDKCTAYNNYFTAVLDSLDAPYKFNTIGHIGYVARKAPYSDTTIYYSEFKEIVDKILLKIIDKNLNLEINLSQKNPEPNAEILLAYKNFGGKNIVYGSDAHEVCKIIQGSCPSPYLIMNR